MSTPFLLLLLLFCSQTVHAADFVLNTDGSVEDQVAGLVWQGNSGQAASATEARRYCAASNNKGYYTWRVPTRDEMGGLESRLKSLSLAMTWAVDDTAMQDGVYCLGDGTFFPMSEKPGKASVRCVANDPLVSVHEAVRYWVGSWQKGDVPAYLSTYTQGFTPTPRIENTQWLEQRRLRLESSAGQISIQLQTESTRLLSAHKAEMIFLQDYRDKKYRDRVRKRLILELQHGRWLIVKEEQLTNGPLKNLSASVF